VRGGGGGGGGVGGVGGVGGGGGGVREVWRDVGWGGVVFRVVGVFVRWIWGTLVSHRPVNGVNERMGKTRELAGQKLHKTANILDLDIRRGHDLKREIDKQGGAAVQGEQRMEPQSKNNLIPEDWAEGDRKKSCRHEIVQERRSPAPG